MRHASACAFVLDEEGRILFQRRSDNGRWCLPGGAIELGETAEQAAVREVREETGYDIEILRLIGVYSDPSHTTISYPDGNTVSYVALSFEGRIIGGRPTISDETLEVAWAHPSDLPKSVLPGHVVRIGDGIANVQLPFVR